MINIKKLTESISKIQFNTLLEYSLSDLKSMSDTERKSRSVGMTSFYKGIDQGQHGHIRTQWEVPSQTGSGKYNCIIEIHVPVKGGLFSISRGKWELKKFSNVLSQSDIKVHCTCPDFYWSGMKYNLGPSGKYKGGLSPNQNAGYKGEPNVLGNDLSPDIRDPKRKHVVCKHLLATFRVFPFNAGKIMSDAKKFDNTIQINDEVAKKLDDGERELKKNVDLVEVADEEKDKMIDSMIQAKEAVDLEKNQENDGTEEIISEEDEKEEISREEPSEETQDIIDEENKEVIEEIEERPETEENTANEIVNPEEDEEELEKDKDIEDSDIPDPNDILGKK